MKLYSTKNKNLSSSLRNAVLSGLASDGGLFMPKEIPKLPLEFFNNMDSLSFQELSFEVAKTIIGNDVPPEILREIIDKTLSFDAPLISIDENINILELFHGPTLAFKDFGARFMARLMSYFIKDTDRGLLVLVATSGDTGSAVAHGFLNVSGIHVTILYPSKKVSDVQEKMLTTMGNNITALEIQGTFDDCQKLVKQAFTDKDIQKKLFLTSANSINIARLIPQSFYYFDAYRQLKNKSKPPVFSVPSGNFGNLTAGLIAKKMGLPVLRFIASTNINDVVPEYLEKSIFRARQAEQTLSNAMDVGNPSNFSRMLELYNNANEMRGDIWGARCADEKTREIIKYAYLKYNYVLDPHTAVGFFGLKQFLEKTKADINGIVLSTAHPAKFLNTVESAIGKNIPIPLRLKEYLDKKKQAVLLSNSFSELKNYLLS